ncbi:MAG: toll/interleukin-1 receptor domain-containing protein [Candidatus Thiodiazotropha sp. (ex Lucina pensylvanica)]|nr:toll/interleukin-1 receptor domain-containing protein [Candidatus Thiodiazotropha sp. (ex Lucina pensylvanica)]
MPGSSNGSRRQYDVFISYQRNYHEEIATALCKGLEERGIRTFMDTSGIEPGSNWIREIEEAIQDAHTFILLQVEGERSHWVEMETHFAIIERATRDQECQLRIIPVVPTFPGRTPPSGRGFIDIFQAFNLLIEDEKPLDASLEALVREIQNPLNSPESPDSSDAVESLTRLVSMFEQIETYGYQPREALDSSIRATAARFKMSGGLVTLFGPSGIGKKSVALGLARDRWINMLDVEDRVWDPTKVPAVAMCVSGEKEPRQGLRELVASASLMLDIKEYDTRSINHWLEKTSAGLQFVAVKLLEMIGEKYGLSNSGPVIVPILDVVHESLDWLPSICPGIVYLITADEELSILHEPSKRFFYRPEHNEKALQEYALSRLKQVGLFGDRKWAKEIADRAGLHFSTVAYSLDASDLGSLEKTKDPTAPLPDQLTPESLISERWQASLFDRAKASAERYGIRDIELKALLGVLCGLRIKRLSRAKLRGLFQAALVNKYLRIETIDWRSLYQSLDLALDALSDTFLMPDGGDELRLWENVADPFIQEILLTDSEWRCCHALIAVACWEAWQQKLPLRRYAITHLLIHLKAGLPQTAEIIAETLLSDFLLESVGSINASPVDLARRVIEPLILIGRDREIWAYSELVTALLDKSNGKFIPCYKKLQSVVILALAGSTTDEPSLVDVENASRSQEFLILVGVSTVVAVDLIRARGFTPSVKQLIELLVKVYADLPADRLNDEMCVWLAGQANGLALALDSAKRLDTDRTVKQQIKPLFHVLAEASFSLYSAKNMLRSHEPGVWENLVWRAMISSRFEIVVELINNMPSHIENNEPDFAAENYRIGAYAAIELWRQQASSKYQSIYRHFRNRAQSLFQDYYLGIAGEIQQQIPEFPYRDSNDVVVQLLRERPKLDCLIICNEFDGYLGLALRTVMSTLHKQAECVHVSALPVARDYQALSKFLPGMVEGTPLVIFLGGSKSPGGMGYLVSSVLEQPRQEYLLWSEEFRGKSLLFMPSSRLLLVAGNGRVATREAVHIVINHIQSAGEKDISITEMLRGMPQLEMRLR